MNLLRIVMIAATINALLSSGCGVMIRGVYNGVNSLVNSGLFHVGRHGKLTDQEHTWAKIAWKYFENNFNPQTGLVNSVDRYPSTTMWHIGDYLAALTAAYEFELIDADEFDERLSLVLDFLNRMDLFYGRLPNKAYNTMNGVMVDYNNQPGEVGWSAIDLGRLLIWLRIIRDRYPLYSEYVDKAVLRWNFCDVIDRCGKLYGGIKGPAGIELFQEGRLGYEEYAALGFQAWGFDTRQASMIRPYHRVRIYGIDILHDARDPREEGTYAPIVTLPYVLAGMEFHWKPINPRNRPEVSLKTLADRVYRVQERRYRVEKIFTARTDHQLGEPPFFVFDAVYAAGYPWNTISDGGDFYPEAALVSTRAAFGMWVLWNTEYTDKLITLLSYLYDPDRGWYEGRYEVSGGHEESITCTTNALVLEALLYKQTGRLFRFDREEGYYPTFLQNEFNHQGNCFPPEREDCQHDE
ncbi:MAG: DUF3131 domain-containing protein [Calditrichaeota bacterium]|nr:MAG: DUF3131 domain-containing protein [Calditrichota bacterium]